MFSQGNVPSIQRMRVGLELGLREVPHRSDHLPLLRADLKSMDGRPLPSRMPAV